MAGYTRNDTPNNIADGNRINASDLDGEFDAIQAAFSGATGHSHDGTAGNAPQITTNGLANLAVTTDKLANTAVTNAKIAPNAVTLGTQTTGNYVATVAGTSPVVVSGSGSETAAVTVSVNDATTTTKGIAQFNSTDFAVASGVVTLNKDPVITLTGAVTGSGTMTNLGSVSIATTATSDPTLTLAGDATGSATFTNLGNATLTVTVVNDSHTHDTRYYTETEIGNFFSATTSITGYNKSNWDTAYGWGNHASAGYQSASTALTTSTTFGGDVSGTYNNIVVADDSHNHVIGNIDNFTESVQDIVGGMVTGNTESGITVTYQDADGTLDFDVNDPTITLSGDVSGSATMTNLGNVNIAVSLTKDPVITLTGAVTGTATMTNLGSVSIATTATSDPTLTLAGDITGSATFANLGNATLTASIANNSVGTDELNVGGTGSVGQVLTSDGDGSMTWADSSAGATAGIFWENDQEVTANYTITSGKNAGTFGPISINSGVTVTVPTGSTWSIV